MSTQVLQESALAEQAPTTEPVQTVLLENEEVLVVATTYAPGASVPIHTHRFPHVAYVIEGGRIETTTADGSVGTYDVRPGETLWSAAAHAHSARNLGTTAVRMVEVEVKRGAAETHVREKREHVLTSANLKWAPDPMDSRRSSTRLVGDPTTAGPYTVRLRVPAGYTSGLHLHPQEDEQLTVLSGTIRWSTGDAGSGEREYTLPSGGFALAPAGTPHRIVALEDSVVQMSGFGPRTYIYVDPTDDPNLER